MSKPAHSRILLKLSGEVLAGKQAYGIDPIKASNLANEIKSAHDIGTTIILVIHLLIAVALVIAVLLQRSEGGGLGIGGSGGAVAIAVTDPILYTVSEATEPSDTLGISTDFANHSGFPLSILSYFTN